MHKKIGWQSPLFYLEFKRVSIKTVLKSIVLWIFFYSKDEYWTFIRILGFYCRKFT